MTHRIASLFLCQILAAQTPQIAPPWVKALPESPGRIYAIGTSAIAPSEAKALEQAAQNARFEVIARLRVGVTGTTTVSTTLSQQQASGREAVGNRQQYVRQEGATSVKAVELPGLIIEERFIDRQTGVAYALAYLDVSSAERTLVSSLNILASEWKGLQTEPPPAGVRPSISRIQRVKTLKGRAEALGLQGGLLIPAGVSTSHQGDAKSLEADMGKVIADLQAGLSMGAQIRGGELGEDFLSILRNVAIKDGFIWTQQNPVMLLSVEIRSANQGLNIRRKSWWDVDASQPDIVGVRANIRVSLLDQNGDAQDGFDVSAKGVGVDEFAASQALIREVRRVLPVKFHEFLMILTQ